MKWQRARRSSNIIDRRGSGGRRRGSTGRAAGGIGGIGAILLLLVGWYFGVDTSSFTGSTGSSGGSTTIQSSGEMTDAEREAGEFVAGVLGSTEDIWTRKFAEQVDGTYRPAELVLFSGSTQSRCGGASASSGPFYCPADRRIYLDTSFFVTLSRRLGAGGDFAAAYVVAHEAAHHVQNELGTLGRANTIRAQVGQAESNAISVQIELQADCYSGIWAREVEREGLLERGDLAEAVNAARQIGDDTLARNAGRMPNPHTFTHGTSEQRQRWFQIGYETGDMRACDTFGADRL